MKRGFLFCLAAFPVVASAQLNVTARESQLNYSYLMGNGGSVLSDANSVTFTDLVSTAEHLIDISPYSQGVDGLGNLWSASAWIYNGSGLVIDGPFSSATGISSGFTTSITTQEDNALVMANAINPGNRTLVMFDVVDPVTVSLLASVENTGFDASAEIALQKWDGVVWQPVYTTTTISSPGIFSNLWEETLSTGSYRMLSQAYVSNFGEEFSRSNGFYLLKTAVPEPGTMALLAVGGLMILRRRKSSKSFVLSE